MGEKPTAAFILSLLGGLFVLLPGLALSALGTFLAFFSFGAGLILWVFPIFGIIIILGAVAN